MLNLNAPIVKKFVVVSMTFQLRILSQPQFLSKLNLNLLVKCMCLLFLSASTALNFNISEHSVAKEFYCAFINCNHQQPVFDVFDHFDFFQNRQGRVNACHVQVFIHKPLKCHCISTPGFYFIILNVLK